MISNVSGVGVRTHLLLPFGFLALIFATSVRADWIVVGAAYRCDKNANAFSLIGTMDTSSTEDPGTIRTPPDFTELHKPSTTINCVIGSSRVKATVSLIEPQPRGMCMGIGMVSLDLLTINGRKVFPLPEVFNSGCFFDPVIFDVKVRVAGSAITIKSCRGQWDWGVGYANSKCEEVTFR